MGRDARHSEQIQAANAARNVALTRLREAHQEEYFSYYVEEASKRNVMPRSGPGAPESRYTKLAKLRAEIAASGVLDEALPPMETGQIPVIPDVTVKPEYTALGAAVTAPDDQVHDFEIPNMPGVEPPIPGAIPKIAPPPF